MDLTSRPFLGTEAQYAGLVTRRTLHSRYRRVFRNVYIHPGVPLTPVITAEAAWLFSNRAATLAGVSAAALHGTKWLDAGVPPELIRAEAGCPGLVVHRYVLGPGETTTIAGMSVTTAARTAFDLGRRKGRTGAVIRLDALANATGVTVADVKRLAARHPGTRGLIRLRGALALADGGAESPQETRTRLVLLDAGLRPPQTQIPVHDAGGYPFARIDMGYEEYKIGIEYDGEQHWTDPKRRAHDIERRIELAEQGWVLIHVTSDMLRNRPWLIVQRDCACLVECGVMPRESGKRVS
jgi:hypothetical protein